MHVHCPNCQSSFEIRLQNLPSPKYNTAHQTFGWKFECGHCDTQWWVSLGGDDEHYYSSSKKPNNMYSPHITPSAHDMLYDLVNPTTQQAMRMSLSSLKPIPYTNVPYTRSNINTNYAATSNYPSTYSPISKEDFGFNPAPNDLASQRLTDVSALKLRVSTPKATRLRKKRPWLLFVLVALLCAGVGLFEYYFPKKIHAYLQNISFIDMYYGAKKYLIQFFPK